MIAYLSTKTSRVYKTYEEAKNDAQIHIMIYVDLPFTKALEFAENTVNQNPKEYINIVFLHV